MTRATRELGVALTLLHHHQLLLLLLLLDTSSSRHLQRDAARAVTTTPHGLLCTSLKAGWGPASQQLEQQQRRAHSFSQLCPGPHRCRHCRDHGLARDRQQPGH